QQDLRSLAVDPSVLQAQENLLDSVAAGFCGVEIAGREIEGLRLNRRLRWSAAGPIEDHLCSSKVALEGFPHDATEQRQEVFRRHGILDRMAVCAAPNTA